MFTKDFVLETIKVNQNKFRKFGVSRLGLFGSFVRNEQTPESDLDFIVDFEEGQKTYDHFYAVAEILENLFNKKIDLLTQKSLSPHLAPYINKEVEYVAISN